MPRHARWAEHLRRSNGLPEVPAPQLLLGDRRGTGAGPRGGSAGRVVVRRKNIMSDMSDMTR